MQDNNGTRSTSRKMRQGVRKFIISVVGGLLQLVAGYLMPYPGVDTGLTLGGILSSTVFYLLIILNSGWWFYLLTPWVRNRMVNIFMFIVLFIFGSELYFFTPVDGNEECGNVRLERQIQAPNRTIAAFFPSRGGYETVGHFRSCDRKSRGTGDTRRIAYFLFHSAVLFYVALLTFAVFGRGFVNRVLKCCVRNRHLNVFWGRSDAAILLARNILNDRPEDEVFFSLNRRLGDGDDRKKLTLDLDGMDALWAFNDDTDECDLDDDSSFGLAKGYRHFFFSDSVHENLVRANRVVCLYKEIGRPHCIWWRLRHPILSYYRWTRPYLYVRVKTPQEEENYATWAANVRNYVNPVLVQESRLIARSLLKGDDSLLKMPDVKDGLKNGCVTKGEFRFLLIGFGSCGQDVLQELICNGQFLRSRGQPVPFAVDVVEKDETVIAQYKRAHPGLCEMYHVNFKGGIRVETEAFDEWVTENIVKYGRVIVCLNGDAMNMGIASQIVEVARCNGKTVKANVVYAKVSDHIRNIHAPKGTMWTIFSKNESEAGPEPVPIRFFGDLKNIYRMSELDAEKSDEMAKVLNVWYNKEKIPEDRQIVEDVWNKAPVFDQMSSRASAEGHRNLLALLGYEAVPAGDPRPEVKLPSALFEKESALAETLAETEHLRWNAFHFTRGFRCWDVLGSGLNVLDVDKIKKQDRDGKVRANQLSHAGRHAYLVPFDKLPDVDLKLARLNDKACAKKREDFVGENKGGTQHNDIGFCRLIPDAAHAVGLKIVSSDVR